MKEMDPIRHEISKEVADKPERRLNTFDDIASSSKSRRIESFDDIARQGHSSDSIRTFDDIRGSDKRLDNKPTEGQRLDEAGERLRQNDWLKPENWRNLDDTEKRVALERAGKQMGEAYHHPEPPLHVISDEHKNSWGASGDGYSYSNTRDKIVGNDYGSEINKDGETRHGEKLFGNNPKHALHTSAYEFRHSYQREQASRFEKGFSVDNPEKANQWAENLRGRNYKHPPEEALAESNPAEYDRKFTEYKNQPVERDSDHFANEITNRVYRNVEDMGIANRGYKNNVEDMEID